MRWLMLVLMGLAAAASADSPPSSFEIDPGFLNDLYQGQIKDVAVESRYRAGGLEIEPSFSYVSPSEFHLKNDYFAVPYGDGSRLPLLKLTLSSHLFHWRDLSLVLEGGAGYGYREAVYTVESKAGLKLNDLISLHVVPLSLSLKAGYTIPFARFLKPIARLSAGAHWLQQSGRLDGMTQAFWIPFYGFGGGINLFDLSQQGESWFGGVSLMLSKYRSSGSSQVFNYSTIDLSMNVVL